MLIGFFEHLRRHGLPVSVQEYLALLGALERRVIGPSLDEFYLLARIALVKDEALFDRYDVAFASYYRQLEAAFPPGKDIPLEWLLRNTLRDLPEADRDMLAQMGWDELMARFRELLQTQQERHEGGSKWIGTGGTSPFGNGGAAPRGIRVGPGDGNRRAVKTWDMRDFRDYDDGVELGTRQLKVALRRLRRFARTGAELELDLDDTIRRTARNAGQLDLRLVPERRNAVKVLMLLDVGGTMDAHVARVEGLFSAARSEFKHLDVYYFHNCPYDWLWRENHRRRDDRVATWDILRTYNADWRVIVVGDASMSPYEIEHPGGSTEFRNAESGAAWLRRIAATFPRLAWLNPEPQGIWPYRQSIAMVRELVGGRMFPVTLPGLDATIRLLSK